MSGGRSWAKDVWYEIRKDRVVYILVASYGFVVAGAALYLGAFERLGYTIPLAGYMATAMRVPAIFLAYLCGVSIYKSPKAPAREFQRRLRGFLVPRLVAGFATVCALALFLGIFTSAKNLLPLLSSFSENEKLIADFDLFLHGREAWTYVQPALDAMGLRQAFEFMYGPLWFLLIVGVPLIVAVSKRFEQIRSRFLVTYCLCWILIGNIAAGYFFSAGPVFYGNVTGDYDRFHELVNLAALSKGTAFSAFDIQSSLWGAYAANLVKLGTGISAFPSVHVSMATLLLLLGIQAGRTWAALGSLYLLIVMVGSVYLGWHYAVDGYFSIAATVVIWKCVEWAYRVRQYPRPVFA